MDPASWSTPPYDQGQPLSHPELRAYQGTEALDGGSNYEAGTPNLAQLLAVRVFSTAPQALTSNVWTPLTFDSIDRQVGREMVAGGNTITIQRQGWYVISLGVSFAANAAGNRGLRLRDTLNNRVIAKHMQPATTVADIDSLHVATFAFFASAVILIAEAFQDSGGSLNTVVEDRQSPALAVGYANIAV